MAESAYPLSWPAGWKRVTIRANAQFKHAGSQIPIDVALKRLEYELTRARADHAVLSSNCPRRVDGSMRLDQKPTDPGVAVYFTRAGARVVFACDKWKRVADNIAAIAAHLEAIRGQERWGVGTSDQAFKGYLALPAPKSWRGILAVDPDTTLEEAEYAYKVAVRTEMETAGSDHHERMIELNLAIARARSEFKGGENHGHRE